MQLGKAEVLIGRKGHNTRSLSRTLKYVLDILQTEKAFTVEEYKHTHTHTKLLTSYALHPSTAIFLPWKYFHPQSTGDSIWSLGFNDTPHILSWCMSNIKYDMWISKLLLFFLIS